MIRYDFISRNNKLRHGDLSLCTFALMAVVFHRQLATIFWCCHRCQMILSDLLLPQEGKYRRIWLDAVRWGLITLNNILGDRLQFCAECCGWLNCFLCNFIRLFIWSSHSRRQSSKRKLQKMGEKNPLTNNQLWKGTHERLDIITWLLSNVIIAFLSCLTEWSTKSHLT